MYVKIKTPIIVASLSAITALIVSFGPEFITTAEAACTGIGYGTGFCDPSYPGYPAKIYGWINAPSDSVQGSSTVYMSGNKINDPPGGSYSIVKNVIRVHDFINNVINKGWSMGYGKLNTGIQGNGYGAIADSDLNSYAYVLHGNPLYMENEISKLGAQTTGWVKGFKASTQIPLDSTSILVNKAGAKFAPWNSQGLNMAYTQPDPYPPNDPNTPDPNAVYSIGDWYTSPFPNYMSVSTKGTCLESACLGVSSSVSRIRCPWIPTSALEIHLS